MGEACLRHAGFPDGESAEFCVEKEKAGFGETVLEYDQESLFSLVCFVRLLEFFCFFPFFCPSGSMAGRVYNGFPQEKQPLPGVR